VCLPTDICDMRATKQLVQRVVVGFARMVTALGFLLVPLWLLLLWQLAVGRSTQDLLAVLVRILLCGQGVAGHKAACINKYKYTHTNKHVYLHLVNTQAAQVY